YIRDFQPGAFNTIIRENNITANKRSIYIGAFALNVYIEDNQIEHAGATIVSNAIEIHGAIGDGVIGPLGYDIQGNLTFTGNNLSAYFTTVTQALLYVTKCTNLKIDKNWFHDT